MIKKLLQIPTSWYLIALLAAGTLVRFFDIAKSSIWHDEGYTMMLAPMGPIEILARTGRDVHPPLYYEALHYWMLAFGNSEVAARGFSAVLMLGVIVVGYLLMRQLFGELTGRLSALTLTFAPFLVRYSQEARMYGMVAFLIILATYLLILAVKQRRWVWWLGYAIVLAAALYTHYYSIFMIPVHWIYMLARSRKSGDGLKNPRWWVANFVAAGLFLPWLPVAYAQFSRVQASFWIPKVSAATLPNTIMQFFTFNNLGQIPVNFKVVLTLIFVGLAFSLIVQLKKQRTGALLMVTYAFFGPTVVAILSYKRPIYVDRYFVFAAVAFYCLLGLIIGLSWPWRNRPRLQISSIAVLLVIFGFGIRNVYVSSNHQMRDIAAIVNDQYQPGDAILSGELYTFFDFSYYNHTDTQVQLWSKNGVNGYGESSLIYDRADQIVVHDLKDIHPKSGYVWVVGKTGTKDYYTKVPSTWTPVGEHYTAGYSAVQKFRVSSRSAGVALVQ
ncbi:MAG TPA: glycosyltransferase family 39 protein [Candidatus Saccharimonadales bacterium]|nr:glycosyltransferase family 39 protein [Candidatus Saccharimonadales bacterium]